MPYVSYVASPDYPGHNRLGYRGPEVEIPKPPGTFRIVALGGSTTYSSATTAEQAYPAQLQQILRDEYGFSNVEVVNAGLSGYTSWDTLANYMFRVTELEPDLLIFYEGINDVQPRAVASECYRGANPLRGLSPTRLLWGSPQVDSMSVLYRVIAIQMGWMPDPSTLEGVFNSYPYRCAGAFVDNERIKDNPPVYFERNLRDLIALAQADDTQVMFSTWTFNPNGDIEAIPPAYQTAVAEHNDIIRSLAAEYDLPIYDLAATDFRQNPDYWANPDPIHMAAPGTHEQARRYAAFLVEQGLIPEPSGQPGASANT
jgi:lysophospholipase L1-like esterase